MDLINTGKMIRFSLRVISKYKTDVCHSKHLLVSIRYVSASRKLLCEKNEKDPRDISGLTTTWKNRMNDRLNLDDYTRNKLHRKRSEQINYDRALYAKYGKQSGIEPGIMWPSISEMEEQIEDENEWEATLQSMVEELNAAKQSAAEERLEKEMFVEKQMEKMPSLIGKFKENLQKIERQKKEENLKGLAMLEEAQDFYGFKISMNDPRYKQFVESKLEEEKKERKRQKKLKQQQLEAQQ